MGIESEIAKQDLLSLWRQFKSERESLLRQRDGLMQTIIKIKACDYASKADATEVTLLTQTENLIKAAGG